MMGLVTTCLVRGVPSGYTMPIARHSDSMVSASTVPSPPPPSPPPPSPPPPSPPPRTRSRARRKRLAAPAKSPESMYSAYVYSRLAISVSGCGISADDLGEQGWQLGGDERQAQRRRGPKGPRQVLAGEDVRVLDGGPQLKECRVGAQPRLFVVALRGPDQHVGGAERVDRLVAGDERAAVVNAELLDVVGQREAQLRQEIGAPAKHRDHVVAVDTALQEDGFLVLELRVGRGRIGELLVDVADQRRHLVGLEDRLSDRGGLHLPRLEERLVG